MRKFIVATALLVLSISALGASETVESLSENLPPVPVLDTEVPKKPNIAEKALQETKSFFAQTRPRREAADYFGLLNYSGLDLLIPSKIGGTIGLIQSANYSWELEYLRGSVSVPWIIDDLGRMTDTRISLIRRSYALRNSFNVSYGLSYFDLTAHLGNKYLAALSGNAQSVYNVDLLKVQALGFNLGLGNRWTFQHDITVGIDWVVWSQPVFVTKEKNGFMDYSTNPDTRDDVHTAVKAASYFPRLSFLKLQIGMLF
jgi:hypothetical protein